MGSTTVEVKGLPSQMWAAEVLEFNKPYTIHKIPTPTTLLPHDLLIRVAVASFCHTDMMILSGAMEPTPSGMSGSHEPVGTVVGLGSAVSDFKTGDRVAALGWRDTCGTCEMCTGDELNRHYCKSMRGFIGSNLPGAFQEYMVVDGRFSAKLPDRLGFVSAAPLTCAGATSWRALIRSGAARGDWMGIVGSVQFAVAKGIRVVAIDAKDGGLELSKKAGAQVVLGARKGKHTVVKQAQEATGGFVKTSLVLSDAGSATELAAAITKMGGTVVQVAQPKTVAVPFQEVIFRDIKIVGSLLASRSQLQDLVKFVVEHTIEVETTMFDGLNSLPEVLKIAHEGNVSGKLVVVLDEEAVGNDKKVEGGI